MTGIMDNGIRVNPLLQQAMAPPPQEHQTGVATTADATANQAAAGDHQTPAPEADFNATGEPEQATAPPSPSSPSNTAKEPSIGDRA